MRIPTRRDALARHTYHDERPVRRWLWNVIYQLETGVMMLGSALITVICAIMMTPLGWILGSVLGILVLLKLFGVI